MIESKSVAVTEAHIKALALTMQSVDVSHAWNMAHNSPEEAIRYSVGASFQSHTWIIDEVPVAIYGISKLTLLSDGANPWLLGSDTLANYRLILLRHSKKWVEAAAKKHGTLRSWVEKDNEGSIKWLKWLGFDIQPPIPVGIEQCLFHKVELRK